MLPKKATCIIIVCTIILLLFLLGIPIGMYLSFGLEDVFVKKDIDNPYVNDQYLGWEEFCLDDIGTIMLPAQWIVKDENGICSIFNTSGDLWAIGTTFGTESACFDSYQEFSEIFASIRPVSSEMDPYSYFMAMKGADIDIFTITDSNGKEESYFVIELINVTEGSFAFFMFADLNDSTIDFEIAEAIVYSFAYM